MPDWSPTGNEIAYAHVDSADRWAIWKVKPDGTDRRRVTADSLGDERPAWSPDGQEIAFDTGTTAHQVFVVNAKGGSPELLTTGGEPRWFHDGARLVVDRAYDSSELAIVTRAGADVHTFTSRAFDGEPATPDVSPNGATIAYVAPTFGIGVALRLIGADGTDDRWLGDPFGGSSFGGLGFGPRWSPNGRWIAYAQQYPDGFSSLALVRPDRSGFRTLRAHDPAPFFPSWSPDGDSLVYALERHYYEDRGSLWIVDRDGRAAHPIAPGCRFGTGGADRLVPSARQRAVFAFAGNDVIRAHDGRREVIDCGPGRDRVIADRRDQVARNCERVLRR